MDADADDPIALFSTLYERASHDCPEPDAMVLSTVDLHKMITKAHEAETVAATQQGGSGNPYAAITEKAAAVRQRWITLGVFAAGAIVGAAAMFFISRFVKW